MVTKNYVLQIDQLLLIEKHSSAMNFIQQLSIIDFY